MDVEYIPDGGVAELRLNRPDKLNALTREMADDIGTHCTRIARDPAIRAVLLTGNGRGFCAGADLAGGSPKDRSPAGVRVSYPIYQGAVRALRQLDKPVICAVRGACVGVGWSLALASDVLLVSDSAKFSMIFLPRGRTPDGGAIWFLRRHLGEFRAKEIVLSGRFVGGAEALELGLATRLVADAELDEAARKQARELAEGATHSVAVAKQLFNDRGDLERYFSEELLAVALTAQTEDIEEGARAWAEKRAPQFKGR
jgi:2-(1,2-epoxy-1,2-dihydrophenyl)acetyl-CoA isomerase